MMTWSKMTIFGSRKEVESRKVLCWYSCQDHRINKQVIDITEKVQPSNLILFYMNKMQRILNMKWTFTQNSNLFGYNQGSSDDQWTTSFLAAPRLGGRRLRTLYSVVKPKDIANFIAYRLLLVNSGRRIELNI